MRIQKKFVLMTDQVIFLGFVVFSREVSANSEKVRAIVEWLIPRSILDVRRFHGLAMFYNDL